MRHPIRAWIFCLCTAGVFFAGMLIASLFPVSGLLSDLLGCMVLVGLLAFAVLAMNDLLNYLAGAERPSGLCASCGYDMRATPARCPECSTEPSASESSEAPRRALPAWLSLLSAIVIAILGVIILFRLLHV